MLALATGRKMARSKSLACWRRLRTFGLLAGWSDITVALPANVMEITVTNASKVTSP